jgi:hypothetical protein
VDETRISTREAALQLGMDANTLRRYARILGITPTSVPHDRKLRTYSADDLRTISERYANDTRKRGHPSRPFPAASSSPSADAYADLQRTISGLVARLARLEANPAPVVRVVPVPAPVPAVAPLSARPTPLVRQMRGDWHTYTDAARWLQDHGVSMNTARGWLNWRDVVPLERSAMLRDALERLRAGDFRVPWRLSWCDDALCPCRDLLPA